MSKSIRLSEKYGVNPTICKCFFCGGDKGIALLGKLKGDVEAPREAVLDYQPCDKCEEGMKQGVTLIEVDTTSPDGRPPISIQNGTKIYPLGGMLVIKAEAAQKIFNAQSLIAGKKLFLDREVFAKLL